MFFLKVFSCFFVFSMGFKELLEKRDFIFCFELSPRQDTPKEWSFLEKAVELGIIHAISVTENLGGMPAVSPEFVASHLKELPIPVILHFSCKDKNRNQIESELLTLEKKGLLDLLIMTGDIPSSGYLGTPKPVFDLDAVQCISLATLVSKKFFKGGVVNPFKVTCEETWLQYFKLYKKFFAGANFFITQSGFVPQKWKELLDIKNFGITRIFADLFQDESLFNPERDAEFRKVPLLGSVIYPSSRIMDMILDLKIPGILASVKVYETIKKKTEKPIELVAKLCAILKELGYNGVHLCGFPHNISRVKELQDLFNKYLNKWEKLFEELSSPVVYNKKREPVKKEFPLVFSKDKGIIHGLKPSFSFKFVFSHVFHECFFSKSSPLFPVLKPLARLGNRFSLLKWIVTKQEYTIKKIIYDCKECGECRLYDYNYNCPFGGCAKGLLNGPCGGSIEGFCEVYPFEKQCLYVKAVKTALSKKHIKKLLFPGKTPITSPRNWKYSGSSSWLNFFLENQT